MYIYLNHNIKNKLNFLICINNCNHTQIKKKCHYDTQNDHAFAARDFASDEDDDDNNTHVERFCERDLREGFVTDNVDDARLLVTMMMMGVLRR